MEKELIILAHYINVGHSSPAHVGQIMQEAISLSKDNVNDPKYRFKEYFYPVTEEQYARTECIFPRINAQVETILKDLDSKYEQLLTSLKN